MTTSSHLSDKEETALSLFVIEKEGKTEKILSVKDSSVESLVIPHGVTEIASGAFSECTFLKFLYIPDTVSVIGKHAFSGCHCLKKIQYDNAFYRADSSEPLNTLIAASDPSIPSVTIFPSTSKIENHAFENCWNLKSILLPSNVFTVGSRAFMNCTSLEKVTFQSKMVQLSSAVFMNCTSLKTVLFDASLHLSMYREGVFQNCSGLHEISFPKSVFYLPKNTFLNCKNLEKLHFDGELSNVSFHAFDGCDRLQISNVDAKEGKELIEMVLIKSKGLTVRKVRIADLFSSFDTYHFFSSDMEVEEGSITLLLEPLHLKDILKNRTSLRFPFPFLQIDAHALSENDYISEVVLSPGCNYIGSEAFSHAHNLEKVVLSEKIKKIENDAFLDCPRLFYNEYDGGMYLGSQNNPYYAMIYAGKQTKKIHPCTKILAEGVFSHSCIQCMDIPRGISELPRMSFFLCNNLKEVHLGKNISHIDSFAFSNCKNLETVYLPYSLSTIERFAFVHCDRLKTVYYEGSEKDFKSIYISKIEKTLLNAKIIYNYKDQNKEDCS